METKGRNPSEKGSEQRKITFIEHESVPGVWRNK